MLCKFVMDTFRNISLNLLVETKKIIASFFICLLKSPYWLHNGHRDLDAITHMPDIAQKPVSDIHMTPSSYLWPSKVEDRDNKKSPKPHKNSWIFEVLGTLRSIFYLIDSTNYQQILEKWICSIPCNCSLMKSTCLHNETLLVIKEDLEVSKGIRTHPWPRKHILKFNSRNTRRRYAICSGLTIKTPEKSFWCLFNIFHTFF